jgi:hypothetical protein
MSLHAPTGELPLFESAARTREAEERRLTEPLFVTAPATPLEHRFAAFHRSNPQIYRALADKAEQLLSQGRRRIGIAELVEELRYDYRVGSRGDPFKINNSHRAFYARLLIFRDKRLDGVIETRVQTHTQRDSA